MDLPPVVVLLLLGAAVTAAGEERPLTAAEARDVIVKGNREWAKARVALDTATFERFLATGFYAQLPDRRLDRGQFLERITGPEAGVGLVRFEPTVLTVEGAGDTWTALIHEKLEYEDASGRRYALVVTRDVWRREAGRWTIQSTEVVGVERWRDGQRPPFADW